MNPLNPKKLLLTKWTAAQPVCKDKHFLVAHVLVPEMAGDKIEWVDIEAVFSRETRRISWRELQNQDLWKQGWV